MKKLIGFVLTVNILVICLILCVSCHLWERDNSMPVNITNIQELSVVLGKDYVYPGQSNSINKIELLGNPDQMPRKVEYGKYVYKAEVTYLYDGAESCTLLLERDGEAKFDNYSEYKTNGLSVRERPIVKSDNKYYVECEFFYNTMRYKYSVVIADNGNAESMDQTAEKARHWVRTQIRDFKLYE